MADNARATSAPCQKVLAGTLALLISACAGIEPHGEPPLAAIIHEARILFVGAHPDDETLAGPVLARACIAEGRPCRIVLLTRGEGGRCDRAGGCGRDLALHRSEEMRRVAAAYSAELSLYDYPNAQLPWSSFPTVEETRRRWQAHGDPVRIIAGHIRSFRPTVILTFDPEGGFTNHPEHRLTAQLTDEAVALASGVEVPELGAPHRADRVYRVLNHHWLPRLFGTADPSAPSESFDTHVPCLPYRGTCLDLALELTRLHESQDEDMRLVRSLRPQMGQLYLRLTRPTNLAPRSSTALPVEPPPASSRSD